MGGIKENAGVWERGREGGEKGRDREQPRVGMRVRKWVGIRSIQTLLVSHYNII